MLGRYEEEESKENKGLNLEYICGGVPQRQAATIAFDEAPLDAGSYLLFIEAEWVNKSVDWMTVTTYAESKIKIT